MENWNPSSYPKIDPKELEGLNPREQVIKHLEHIGMVYINSGNEDSEAKPKFNDEMIDLICELWFPSE